MATRSEMGLDRMMGASKGGIMEVLSDIPKMTRHRPDRFQQAPPDCSDGDRTAAESEKPCCVSHRTATREFWRLASGCATES